MAGTFEMFVNDEEDTDDGTVRAGDAEALWP